MTSNFKLVTLAVLTPHQHSITRCSRTVAFHMNSNNNRSHVCSRLRMLLHLGKLLKADYRVKKQMFSEDLAHPNPPVCARQYPKPPRTDKKKKSLTQRVRHRATELKSPCQCLHLTVEPQTACNKQKNNTEPCDWWEVYWRLKLFMFRFSFQILKTTFQ